MLANPERQEIQLTAHDRVYTLKLTTNASCALEGQLGKTTKEILEAVSQFSLASMRSLLQAMLQKHHAPEFPYTKQGTERVGDLIDDCGGIKDVLPILASAVGFQGDKDKDLAEKGPNPPEAQAGTGADSRLTLVGSA